MESKEELSNKSKTQTPVAFRYKTHVPLTGKERYAIARLFPPPHPNRKDQRIKICGILRSVSLVDFRIILDRHPELLGVQLIQPEYQNTVQHWHGWPCVRKTDHHYETGWIKADGTLCGHCHDRWCRKCDETPGEEWGEIRVETNNRKVEQYKNRIGVFALALKNESCDEVNEVFDFATAWLGNQWIARIVVACVFVRPLGGDK